MNNTSSRKLATALLFGCVVSAVSLAAVPPADSAQTSQNSGQAPTVDRSQWRKLQRGMSKDDVRKLIGEPGKVSVAKYYEFWYYAGGNVTFDAKGRLDAWNEP
jgi:outer membrane protein assembly factor BamE (lipoprotein component of BamABCDE complex)